MDFISDIFPDVKVHISLYKLTNAESSSTEEIDQRKY